MGSLLFVSIHAIKTYQRNIEMQKQSIQEIIHRYDDEWLRIPGVEGMGVGELDERPCIVIFASIPADELGMLIPEHIEGYPVIIKETDTFEAGGS